MRELAEKYCDLVSEEEINKAEQLCIEQELCIQETLTFLKSF